MQSKADFDPSKIMKVSIGDVYANDYNPKKKNTPEYKKVVRSLQLNGLKQPIMVREVEGQYVIVDGEQRYTAAKELGYTELYIYNLGDIPEAEAKALTLWMEVQVPFDDIQLEPIVMELNKLNIEVPQVDIEVAEPDDIIEDEAPEVDESEPAKSELGKVYQLGNHRLMCGDSTDAGSVAILMDGQKADMVFTDPPYNMEYSGAGFINEQNENIKKRIANIIDFEPHSISYLTELGVPSLFFFTSKDCIKDYLDVFDGWSFNLLTWHKSGLAPMLNNNFWPDTEYLLYFHKGKRVWNNNLKPLDIYNKYYISSSQEGKKDGGGDLHPTMKPLKLISNEIKICSNIGGSVLDIFGGSGSTLIACEQLGRRCYMMELDPKYCDVIRKRYWKFVMGDESGWESGTAPIVEEAYNE